LINRTASSGFERGAADYERARPSYPQAVLDALPSSGRIVDLAAGTGKLTRLLRGDVVAVEPVAAMRAVAAEFAPTVAGTAEHLPLRDESVDAVTVAQAFHWFDADAAFAELARVLRPGGRVGLVWNARDRSVDWVDQVWAIMDRVEKRAPWRDHDRWSDSALGDRPGFGPIHTATFDNEEPYTPTGVVDRFRGVSHVAALPADQRDAVLAEIRDVLATHPDTRGRDELRIPYRVDAHWCERR
jgi:SAM-dependent methyltransferase